MARFFIALGFVVALAAPAFAEPPTEERPHEILSERPSGFWTSNRPAIGGAYKYRLLAIGVVICGLTGFLTYRLVKNAKGPSRKVGDPMPVAVVLVRVNSSERQTKP
jgi:hypothetical protein